MSITITINGSPVQFPSSSESPNWAPAIIEFAQLVEGSLIGLGAGAFDVAPQVMIIDTANPGVNVDIVNLTFPVSTVRSANIRYAVYRTTSTDTAYETGLISVVYNTSAGSWEISREYTGDGKITFSITNVGQMQFTTVALAGINHVGRLTFSAQTLNQN